MTIPTLTDVVRVAVAALQAQYPDRVGEIARAHAAMIDGQVIADDQDKGRVLSRDGHTLSTVNGVWTCQAAAFGTHCRPLSAGRLSKPVAKNHAARTAPAPGEGSAQQDPDAPPPGSDPRFISVVHGKPCVPYAGLLALAPARGGQALHAEFVSVTAALALAPAPFAAGRSFRAAADSPPDNGQPGVRQAVARLPLTRATARALREALPVGMCAVEELGDESHG